MFCLHFIYTSHKKLKILFLLLSFFLLLKKDIQEI